MKSWGFLLLYGGIFILVTSLALVFQNIFREVLINPLLYFLWVVNLAIKSISQVYIWAFLLVIIAAIFIRRLTRIPIPSSTWIKTDTRDFEAGRLNYWLGQIYHLEGGEFSKKQSVRVLKELLMTVLLDKGTDSRQEVEQEILAGEIDIPPVILRQFFLKKGIEKKTDPDIISRIKKRFIYKFKGDDERNRVFSELEILIKYMEDHLEINKKDGIH